LNLDPYAIGMIKKSPYVKKKIPKGNVVVILDFKTKERGLNLIMPHSRAVKKNEIHEIMTTADKDAAPGKGVNDVAYVGFFEVEEGGVIVIGDSVYVGKKLIGKVVGFDDTHMPNHQNIVLYSAKDKTGKDLNIDLNEEMIFIKKGDEK